MFKLLVLLLLSIPRRAFGISFVFSPGESNVYTGYLWRETDKIYIRPRLQAVPNSEESTTNQLCGIKITSEDGVRAPLHAKISDPSYGFAELLVDDQQELVRSINSAPIFFLEAHDCDTPPHVSSKVPIRIHVINGSGPFFVEPSYTFTVSPQNYVNGLVGQVQAIARPSQGTETMYSAICNYLISSPAETPFTIDRNGVIRIQQKLSPRSNNKPYMLKVIAEDCNRPTPRQASVDVIVRQIAQGCQAGWTGLPSYLEYRNDVKHPGKLLHPYKLGLEFCVNMCEEPEIRARLELQSAVSGYTLKTANPAACLHDPEHLLQQQLICGLHPTTLTNFLPNADHDIASQLLNPGLGNPPRLSAPSMIWRFNASQRTVWQVDPTYLATDPGMNAFDLDFTVTFWLRRYAGAKNYQKSEQEEEVVLCSQDRRERNWRFLSIGFNKCHLVVRLLASLKTIPATLDPDPRQPSVWNFGPLPEEYCTPSRLDHASWHHFAVTFSRSPQGSSPELVSIMLDGMELDEIGTPTQTRMPGLPPFNPESRKADPQITIGACYDPETRLTTDHLNADLAGLTVLTERAEAMNNLRCVSHCGESLIIPDLRKHLKSDVSVDMESHAITVIAQNLAHVVEVLQSIAYVRPQSGTSPGYTPHAVQTRILNLTTTYSCTNAIELPTSTIQMSVFPENMIADHSVQLSQPTDGSNSRWVAENAQIVGRSPIAQADMEKKAWIASKIARVDEAPPTLLIECSDIVITEPPIEEPGVQIFSDIHFSLPDQDESEEARAAAASVPLDSCLVWIASTKGLRQFGEGRIQWSVRTVQRYGMYGADDKHGVEFRGVKPAGDYEKVLKTLHYFPPKDILYPNGKDTSDVRLMAKIGVMCTLESGKKTTSQLFVNVVIESPENVAEDLSTDDAIRNLSPDDENFPPSYLQSDRQRLQTQNGKQRLRARDLGDEQSDIVPTSHPSQNNRRLAIGLSVTAFILVVAISLIVGLHVVNRRARLKPIHRPHTGRRRRFPAKPADFGGSSLKHDPTLRLTANPIGEVEYRGIGIVSEDLYGSSRNIAPRENIFSPPLSQQEAQNSWAYPPLAGLHEFDEDYGPNEEFYGDEHSHMIPPSPPEEHSVHQSHSHGAEVHEYIDAEGEEESGIRQDENHTLDTKCHLVATCTPDEFGPPVVEL